MAADGVPPHLPYSPDVLEAHAHSFASGLSAIRSTVRLLDAERPLTSDVSTVTAGKLKMALGLELAAFNSQSRRVAHISQLVGLLRTCSEQQRRLNTAPSSSCVSRDEAKTLVRAVYDCPLDLQDYPEGVRSSMLGVITLLSRSILAAWQDWISGKDGLVGLLNDGESAVEHAQLSRLDGLGGELGVRSNAQAASSVPCALIGAAADVDDIVLRTRTAGWVGIPSAQNHHRDKMFQSFCGKGVSALSKEVRALASRSSAAFDRGSLVMAAIAEFDQLLFDRLIPSFRRFWGMVSAVFVSSRSEVGSACTFEDVLRGVEPVIRETGSAYDGVKQDSILDLCRQVENLANDVLLSPVMALMSLLSKARSSSQRLKCSLRVVKSLHEFYGSVCGPLYLRVMLFANGAISSPSIRTVLHSLSPLKAAATIWLLHSSEYSEELDALVLKTIWNRKDNSPHDISAALLQFINRQCICALACSGEGDDSLEHIGGEVLAVASNIVSLGRECKEQHKFVKSVSGLVSMVQSSLPREVEGGRSKGHSAGKPAQFTESKRRTLLDYDGYETNTTEVGEHSMPETRSSRNEIGAKLATQSNILEAHVAMVVFPRRTVQTMCDKLSQARSPIDSPLLV